MKKRQTEAIEARFLGRKSGPLMVSTLSKWYGAKHRRASEEETAFANSIEMARCPRCGSADFSRDGHRPDGLQRYECRACGAKFSPLAGTAFDSHKIPLSEWVEFLIHPFEFHSVAASASDNRNAGSTGLYWLSKVFFVLRGCQESVALGGAVKLDEAYVPRWKSLRAAKGGKELRGLSRNQFCIASATDGKRCSLVLCGVGKPSFGKAVKGYAGHVSEGSKIIHDGDKSHNGLIGLLGLSSEVHAAEETKGLADEDTRQQGSPLPQGLPFRARGLFKGQSAGLAQSLPLHLEHPGGQIAKGPGFHRTGGRNARAVALSRTEEKEKWRLALILSSPRVHSGIY